MRPLLDLEIQRLTAQVQSLTEQDRWQEAVEVFRPVPEAVRQRYGAEHEAYFKALKFLADLFSRAQDHGSAETHLQRALEVGSVAVRGDHPDLLAVLDDLAYLRHRVQADYQGAVELLQRRAEILRSSKRVRSRDYTLTLSHLGAAYLELQDYAAAEAAVQEAIGIQLALTGQGSPDLAELLDNLAHVYKERKDYARAIELSERAAEIFRGANLDSERLRTYTSILRGLATLHHDVGNYAAAERQLREAARIVRQAFGESDPELPKTLAQLGGIYGEMGRYREAEALLREAKALGAASLGEAHPEFSFILSNLASMCSYQGNQAEAEALQRQATEVFRTGGAESRPPTVGVRGGDSDASRHPHLAGSLTSQGIHAFNRGDLETAESLMRRALDILREAGQEGQPIFAETLSKLVPVYEAMASHGRSVEILRQVIEIYRKTAGEQNPRYAEHLLELARIELSRGAPKDAGPPAVEASRILKSTLGPEHPKFLESLRLLATLHLAKGELARSEELLRQALEAHRKSGLLPIAQADIVGQLGHLAMMCGNFAAAEERLAESRKLAEPYLDKGSFQYARLQIAPAQLLAATGRTQEALALLQQAEAVIDRTLGQIFSMASEDQRMAYLESLRFERDLFLTLVLRHFPHSRTAVGAALDLVLRRKGIGAEALLAQRAVVLGGKYPHLRGSLERLQQLQMAIGAKLWQQPAGEDAESRQVVAAWMAEREQLETELARQIPEMKLELELRSANHRAVARALPEGSAMVEIVRLRIRRLRVDQAARDPWETQPDRYLAFVLSRGKAVLVQMIDLGSADAIDACITRFRFAITGEDSLRNAAARGQRDLHAPEQPPRTTYHAEGSRLRRLVFDPLRSALAGCKRLLLAPDGDLCRLPFEVLPTSGGAFLIDEVSISYLSTGRDLLRTGVPARGKPTPPLVAADPDFDLASAGDRPGRPGPRARTVRSGGLERSGVRFSRLPGTRREGESVASLLGVKPYLGDQVLESRIKACRSPRILHLATHGFFLPDQKRPESEPAQALSESLGLSRGFPIGTRLEDPLLRSGLALAGANLTLAGGTPPAEAEDGILTAVDVLGLDLSATALVVLSACQTGLGDIRIGEGVFGLRRAFVLAGARTLVMTLWKVPDEQTRELMCELHRRLLVNRPCAEALREAQLSLKAKYPDPFVWGAFICQGDPGPMTLPVP